MKSMKWKFLIRISSSYKILVFFCALVLRKFLNISVTIIYFNFSTLGWEVYTDLNMYYILWLSNRKIKIKESIKFYWTCKWNCLDTINRWQTVTLLLKNTGTKCTRYLAPVNVGYDPNQMATKSKWFVIEYLNITA